jgi:putative hydrolase of the HAD superfamily
LRERGHRLVVVSNWDCALPHWLAGAGLLDLVDGVVTSAGAGAAKPDPAIFAPALEIAAVPPGQALHVGDSLDKDVAGARAAGIRPVLLCRDGPPPAGVQAIATLTELLSLV